jgi:uncharacterized membrane protein YgaE (UPF0421/DUF939 family)
MAHHNTEKKENIDNLYYLVGVLAGIFTGAVIEFSLLYIFVGAIVGLLFSAFFLNVLVKGREDK